MPLSLARGRARLLIEECKVQNLLRNEAANVLAQCHWETGGKLQPVRETFATSDAQAKARLTKAWKAGQLTWVTSDYWSGGFFGRGFIQITHKENYSKAGREIGVDLVGNPSLALEPRISAAIAVRGMKHGWFTGKKLSNYITLQKSDWSGARAIVNGDKGKKPKGEPRNIGQIIADLSYQYDRALKAEGYGAKKRPKEITLNPSIPKASELKTGSEEISAPKSKKPESITHSKRFWTWLTTGGGTAVLPFVDWRVQFLIVVVVVGFAVFAIATMPKVREKLGIGQ